MPGGFRPVFFILIVYCRFVIGKAPAEKLHRLIYRGFDKIEQTIL